MVAMRDGFVAAIRSMPMIRSVLLAFVVRCALSGIVRVDFNFAFVDMTLVKSMEMAIMQKIKMVAVFYFFVAAPFAMQVRMAGVGMVLLIFHC